MNKLRYKLVFSKHWGMLVPTSEIAKSHQGGAGFKTPGFSDVNSSLDLTVQKPLWRVAVGYVALMMAGVLTLQPLVSIADTTLPTGGTFASGLGSINTIGSQMNINTTTNNAVIRWDGFNIGRNAGVNFAMPNRFSSVLNRVMGTAPSQIYGSLTSNGHVYIVNQNGIIFGNGAQINVGSLTATTLDDVRNNAIEGIYNNGILSDLTRPVFSAGGVVGSIEVERGANINTVNGGRVMLLAPDVTNSGVINTPDGQTLLAAGRTVYLSKADENILVEVSSGGTAKNLGNIVVGNGHASLVGLAVNQEGIISATTSVRNKGEILLKAKQIQALNSPSTDRFGTVTLAAGSKTQVLVDVDSKELAKVGQNIGEKNQSIINIQGRDILIDGNLTANAGKINVTANANGVGESKIYLGSQAVVDVSGVTAEAPMSRNQLAIQLFSEQLKDSPALRGGPLFGEVLYLDASKGSPIIAESVITQARSLQDQTIAEAMTKAGSISFNADNVITKAGSVVNISGGQINYTEGRIKESKLLLNGKWVNASDAKAGLPYEAIDNSFNKFYARWGQTRSWSLDSDQSGNFRSAYTQGFDAGALNINAKSLAFEGNILAKTVVGEFQRGDYKGEKSPLGGAFNLNYSGTGLLNFVANLSNPLDASFIESSALNQDKKDVAEIDTKLLKTGVNRLTVNAAGRVNVNAELNIQPNGLLALDANGGLNVNANINAAGGNVTLSASDQTDVVLANNVVVSTSGLLTNDAPGVAGAMTGLIVKDAGNIAVQNGLVMRNGAKLEANAGAWLKQNRSLEVGHGGDITVTLAQNTVEPSAFSSYGLYANRQTSAGGKLTINLQGEGATSNVKDIVIGGANPNLANTLWLDEGFFSRGGFSSYALSNSGRVDGDVVIGSQTTTTLIQPKQAAKTLNVNYLSAVSGTNINQVSTVTELPAFTRNATALSISAGDDLILHEGASITTEAPTSLSGKRGNVDLSAHGQMTILGDITAPAADISLTLLKTEGDAVRQNGRFDPTLSLYVGEKSSLSAKGQYIVPPTADGNLGNAQVADAGKIKISTENGVVVLKQGSQLDVSATSGNVDLPTTTGFSRQQVDGNAGTIELNARDGLAADATLLARASGQGAAGTLKVVLGGDVAPGTEGDANSPQFFTNGQRVLTVTQNQQVISANNQAGTSVSNLIETNDLNKPLTNAVGKGQISQAQIAAGGFDNVDLQVKNVGNQANSRIAIESGAVLTAPSRLSLDATSIAGGATINAATVTLKNTGNTSLSTPTQGAGAMVVNANFIDLIGNVTLDQVNSATLNSRSDIRGRGNANGLQSLGSLTVPNQLTLDAKQIYPTSAATFNIKATGAQSRVEIKNTQGTTPAVPMSAQGKLNIEAANIVQSGNLRAPLGEINLNATESLTLSGNSLTSVSAEGSVIPYLTSVLSGTKLVQTEGQEDGQAINLNAKKISFNSKNIDLQNGATVDISGGGDTLSYEWLPGIGGSENILAKEGYYAILPRLGEQYAPYDFLFYGANTSNLLAGQAVYLNGGDGLSAGTYTLLPARYALVPGAYLVKVDTQKSIAINSSLTQLDGSTNMSGYFRPLDGTSRGQYANFNINSGKLFYENVGTKNYKGPSEYFVTYGNQHYINRAQREGTAVQPLPADAGQLSITAENSLNLQGKVLAQKVAGAKGALVDISSNKIQVVSNIGPQQAGVLQVSASQLSNIQADSLMLGGTRQVTGNTYEVNTQASEVTFNNDGNNPVERSELIVTAKDQINLKSGSVIKTTGQGNTQGTVNLTTSGDGALLAVSGNNNLSLNRTGALGNTGNLVVEKNAKVEAARSAVLDSTKGFDQFGEVLVGNNGSLTLGSQQFVLGDAGATTATKLDTATLQSYGQLSSVTLNSYKQIDLFGGFNFGSKNLNLTLNSTGLAHQGTGDVVINAKTLTLNNTLGTGFVNAVAQNSQLTFNTENTTLGTATLFNISGFNAVNVNADQAIKLSGTGNVNINAAQTTLKSAVVTADSGAKYNLSATGKLDTVGNGNQAAPTNGLGANVTLSSSATTIGNRIEVLAGQVQATSTNGALKVSSDGKIITKAATVQFDKNYAKTTDAGDVTLTSNTDNVEIAQNALIDVSGGSTQGDAGSLTVNARNGQFIVADGTLKGTASANEQTGQFNLDVNQLPNFSGVNKALESGGFTQARDIRVRTGNVNIAATDTVTAKQFALGVDAGNIEVAGTVNADGAKGGDVAMYASGTVTLKNTAKISAKGTQANQSTGDAQTGSGGKVLLSSNSSAINAVSADDGALIDVSGYDKATNNNVGVDGADGSVTLRGRRGTVNQNTVNVDFKATGAIKGASEVRVEGVRTYIATTFASTITGLVADTNNFYNANPGAGNYVNTQDGLAAQILPYIEIRSTADNNAVINMSSTADHNLRAFGALLPGRGGVVALRSSGDLNLNTISDGFSTALATTGVLQANTKTFDLSFIAGADYNSANVDKTVKGRGNLTMTATTGNTPAKIIRTGEGDITMAAGNNISLNNGVVYTVGKAATDAAGFSKPSTSNSASYVNNGGDVRVMAQGDITANATTQSVNQWLLRQAGNASSNADTSWWVRPDLFAQGVAALGGGDVSITAGGNITNVSASSATNAQFDNRGANPTNNSVVNGGGDVSVSAGGNVSNGVYYVGRGKLNIDANGTIGRSGQTNSQGLLIALQDGSAEVSATGNVKVDTVFNPTLWAQGSTNSSVANNNSYFNTYSNQASFDVASLVGAVQLGLQNRDHISSTGLNIAVGALKNHDYGAIHPGIVNATAFTGDITAYKMILAPTPNGQLQLLAANNVTAVTSNSTGSQSPTATVIISDADVTNQFTVNQPFVGNVSDSTLNSLVTSFKTGSAATPVYKGDTKQSVIIARDGDVDFKGNPSFSTTANVYGLKSAMPMYISAGKDVTMHASIQHNNTGDMTIVKAGNDFIMDLAKTSAVFEVQGPGNLVVEASRNIDLGKTTGILSLANTKNSNLPSNGANVSLLAGLGKEGAAVNEFVASYINPLGKGPTAISGDANKTAAYRALVATSVQEYMQAVTADTSLTEAQAMQLFLKLDSDKQKPLVYGLFGKEMVNAIVDYVKTASTTRGDQLIEALFPKIRTYQGDIQMYQSQVKTSRTGDVNLMTPGGLINAGLAASSSANLGHDIGIVTERVGAIRVYSSKGFEINQSKVATLFGAENGRSDLSAWVNQGDIDAGRGSKTAFSAPERIADLDAFGNPLVEIKGVAAGSGISTSSYDPDGPAGPLPRPQAGTVYLAAPRGALDAGEAGVSSGGNLFIGAQVIQNATNITAAGSSTGVPVADTGSLAGSLAGLPDTAAGVTSAMTENLNSQLPSQNAAPKTLPPIVSVKTIRLED